jgi:hypothetical protein
MLGKSLSQPAKPGAPQNLLNQSKVVLKKTLSYYTVVP